jgi:hypothetical protein
MNPQLTISGALVAVPLTTMGNGPGGTSCESAGFQIVDSAGTVVASSASLPGSGASVTAGNFTVHNLGTTGTIGGDSYYNLSIQALSGATAATGYAFEQIVGAGTDTAFGLFDVVALTPPTAPAAPTFTGVTSSGIGVVIPALSGGATSYNLQRAPDDLGAPGAWSTVSDGVTPSATYTDNESGAGLTPSTTYFYRLQAVNGGGTTDGPPASQETEALTTTSVPLHLFSSGVLTANWTDAENNPQSEVFARLQNISLSIGWTRKEAWECVSTSVFPVDSADSGGKATLKAETASISAVTLQQLIAAALTGTNPITATLGDSVELPAMEVTLAATASSGKTVTLTANVAKAKGVELALKQSDFATTDFQLDLYPDDDDDILTIAFTN